MDLRDASLGFYRVWLAATGARHALFERLVAWRTPAALARATRLDAEALERWCRGAWAVGLLERERDCYRTPPGLRRRLAAPEHPEYLGHHFLYLAQKSLGFGQLGALLEGKPRPVALADTYAIATRWDHVAFFDLVLPRHRALAASLRAGIDVLDLGAGAGGWTREAASRFPRSRFVAADVDAREVRKAARALRGMRRAKALPASRVADGSFDMVFLGEVLAAAQSPADVLAAAHRALRPGGRLVALEGLRPAEGRAPRGWGERLVLAMDFDFGLDGSRFLAVDEAARLVRDAGFQRAAIRDLGGSLFSIVGKKRADSSGRGRLRAR